VAPVVYFGLLRASQRARNLALAILGYIFYGWANPWFVFLMFGTTFVDWLASLVIARNTWSIWKAAPDIEPVAPGSRTSTQRTALLISLFSNLGMLGFFKSTSISGVDSYNALVSAAGLDAAAWHPVLRVVLPLGISFYTFQSLSYIIDVYRGDATAMTNFVDFSCFVSMFPHLVAGPILQFSFLADQLRDRSLTTEKFARGVALFSLGLGKKVLLANPCGHVADAVFGAAHVSAMDAWYGALSLTPFKSISTSAAIPTWPLVSASCLDSSSPKFRLAVQERVHHRVLRRWHISLSTWLRDYLYVPLGGNRRGTVRTHRNLMLTMLLGGLGTALVEFCHLGRYSRRMPRRGARRARAGRPIAILASFEYLRLSSS
jgi:alginate O-acetyltransferase complex protein AlgI